MRFCPVRISALLVIAVAPALAKVTTSEFVTDPIAEGWEVVAQWGVLTTWTKNDVYYQRTESLVVSGH